MNDIFNRPIPRPIGSSRSDSMPCVVNGVENQVAMMSRQVVPDKCDLGKSRQCSGSIAYIAHERIECFARCTSNFFHFEPIMEQALGRVPALQTAGVKMLTNGPESFTPDGNFILGEAPELKMFTLAPALTAMELPLAAGRGGDGAGQMGGKCWTAL